MKLDDGIINPDWGRAGIFDHEVAHLLFGLLKDTKEGRVTALTARHKFKVPPPALHTVELLRVASSKLHIGPKQAMDVAERLYTEVGLHLLCQCSDKEGSICAIINPASELTTLEGQA